MADERRYLKKKWGREFKKFSGLKEGKISVKLYKRGEERVRPRMRPTKDAKVDE